MRDLQLVTFVKACSKNQVLEAFDQLLDKRICFEIEREVFSEIARSQNAVGMMHLKQTDIIMKCTKEF